MISARHGHQGGYSPESYQMISEVKGLGVDCLWCLLCSSDLCFVLLSQSGGSVLSC